MNIVLIGYGYWGKNLARVIDANTGCRLIGIVESDRQRTDLAKLSYPNTALYLSYSDIMNLDDVDAAVIATPAHTHVEITEFFLKNNKHVLCEKYLSADIQNLNRLHDLASQKGLVLMVGYTFLYNDVVREIKQRLDRQDLGEVYYATFKRTGLGPIREDVDVIADLAVHDISIALLWFGMPQWARCTKGCILKKAKADVAFLQMGYSDGLIINIHVSWINPMKQRLVEIVGQKQMLIFDDVSTTEKLRIVNSGKDYFSDINDFGSFQSSIKDGDIIIPNIHHQEPLNNELNHFIRQVTDRHISDSYGAIPFRVAEVLGMI